MNIEQPKLTSEHALYCHDGKKFSKIICLVGRDIDYGVSTIEIIIQKKIQIVGICGETAEIVSSKLASGSDKYQIRTISIRRPWQSAMFNDLAYQDQVIGINCGFDYIVPEAVLKKLPLVNIHPAYLPYNRGCHHSFWGIIDKTPLGASIHWMTPKLDEGPIIARMRFDDDGFMSASEIQKRSNDLCLQLLSENVLMLLEGSTKSTPQEKNGTYHAKDDIKSAITLREYDIISSSDLFDLCRATNNKGFGFLIKKEGGLFMVRIDSIVRIS